MEGEKKNQRAEKKSANVLLVGALPPPVHGMSMINREMSLRLQEVTCVFEINIAPVGRFFLSRIVFRFLSVIKGAVWSIFSDEKWDVLYIGLSGGWGQIYEIIFVLIARIYRKKIYVHHHSFAYINKKKIYFWLLSYLAGPECTHITLSKGMSYMILSKYPRIKKDYTLSNVAFIDFSPTETKRTHNKINIGFLSNISFEKGIRIFFETLEVLRNEGIAFEAIIAGPIEDRVVQKYVIEKVGQENETSYIGPVYGKGKIELLERIDVLFFPTLYENEAEPLTIYECHSYGVPVISLKRGCISEMMEDQKNLCVSESGHFPLVANRLLSEWMDRPEKLRDMSLRCKEVFHIKKAESEKHLKHIISSIAQLKT